MMSTPSRARRGFTLIELLVVIAIIGILSAIVLASLGTARSKATDVAIEGDVGGARAQAEIYYDIGRTYSGVCNASNGLANMSSSARTAGSADVACYDTSNHAGTDTWVLSAQLKGDTSKYFCLDTSGTSTVRTTQIAANATGC